MTQPEVAPFVIKEIKAWPLRAPISTPRRNAFGTQTSRTTLFLEMTLDDGTTGWGEVFANWPQFAALHRARIVEQLIKPLIVGREFATPQALWTDLTQRLGSLAIQCAEPGPFQSAIAGVEIAVWNCLANQKNIPLVQMLGGARSQPRPYASGLTGDMLARKLPELLAIGWTAFKLKVGFGRAQDEAALHHFRQIAGNGVELMVDANMAWSVEEALLACKWLEPFDLQWIEEPIRADSDMSDWARIARNSAIPIAAGENHTGLGTFQELLDAEVGVLQPDPVKWGGLAQTLAIGEICAKQGKTLAPHFLGGAIGLDAVKHVAQRSGATFLEVDVTENPLRFEALEENIERSITPELLHKYQDVET